MSKGALPTASLAAEVSMVASSANEFRIRESLLYLFEGAKEVLMSLPEANASYTNEAGLRRQGGTRGENAGIDTIGVEHAFGFGNAVIEHGIPDEFGRAGYEVSPFQVASAPSEE
jgi:hypothetical protein